MPLCLKSAIRGKGEHVVVVDDDDLVQKYLVTQLVGLGYNVESAKTAFDALKYLENGNTDLVISDVSMPGMSGFQLLEIAKKQNPDVGFILISGYKDAAESTQQPELSKVAFLAKPFRIYDLSSKVRAALDG